jgi:hypothetical protein
MLPLLAFVGHKALYIVVGFLCFPWLKDEGEESTTVDQQAQDGYHIGALLFFFLFLDNLLRRIEGQGWQEFWPCSGRLEVVVLCAVLSLLAEFAYWMRIVRGLNQERV